MLDRLGPCEREQVCRKYIGAKKPSSQVSFFGVSDKPREIVGVEEIVDEARWADRIREEFDPEIPLATRAYKVGTLRMFAVGVDPVPNKPIVCRKSRSKRVSDKQGKMRDIEVIREGAIYYRYAGQTRSIGYPELMAIIAEREARRIKSFMDTINVIQKVGVRRRVFLRCPKARPVSL